MFDDVRLPEDIERGASGGPQFNTSIVEDDAGLEQRNQNWRHSRMRWTVGYGARSAAELRELVAFFYRRQGRARGFRFKDWSDYKTASDADVLAGDAVPQPVWIDNTDPDNVVYRLALWYGDGEYTDFAVLPHRIVVLPVGSVKFYRRTGVNTYAAAGSPRFDVVSRTVGGLNGEAYWTGEFDVPVRFDVDRLDIDMDYVDSARIPELPIVELNYANL